MRHDQETSPLGDTNGHKAHLVLGMSLVREGRRQRVFENSGCFIKTDAAASDVRRSLLGIPFELHRVSIRPSGGLPSNCPTQRPWGAGAPQGAPVPAVRARPLQRPVSAPRPTPFAPWPAP